MTQLQDWWRITEPRGGLLWLKSLKSNSRLVVELASSAEKGKWHIPTNSCENFTLLARIIWSCLFLDGTIISILTSKRIQSTEKKSRRSSTFISSWAISGQISQRNYQVVQTTASRITFTRHTESTSAELIRAWKMLRLVSNFARLITPQPNCWTWPKIPRQKNCINWSCVNGLPTNRSAALTQKSSKI